jgi:hypothetical protein
METLLNMPDAVVVFSFPKSLLLFIYILNQQLASQHPQGYAGTLDAKYMSD